MINKITSINNKNKYDLIERTAKFGEDIIDFAKTITPTPVTRQRISQLVRRWPTTIFQRRSRASKNYNRHSRKLTPAISRATPLRSGVKSKRIWRKSRPTSVSPPSSAESKPHPKTSGEWTPRRESSPLAEE